MQAVILVGGKSTRMKSNIPKSLLKKNKKTFLQHTINMLNKQGIYDITLKIEDRTEFNNLPYKKIKKLTQFKPNDDYIILVGDILIYNLDIKKILKFHKSHKKGITSITTDIKIPYGVIENEKWFEKPKKEISLGYFIVDKYITGNSIHIIRKKGFKTYKIIPNFTHLTKKEDYIKWKKQKNEN